MPIEVTTEYTYPLYRKFYNFHTFFRTTGRKILWIVLLAILTLAFALNFAVSIDTGDFSSTGYVTVLAVFWPLYFILLPRMAYKGMVVRRGLTEHCHITEEAVQVNATHTGAQSVSTYQWEAILTVYETKELFLLYIAKNQAILIDKSAMADCDVIRLAGLSAAKLGDKFHKT